MMDALLRLGARAIGSAMDATAVVRPTIAPVHLAGPSRRPGLPTTNRIDEAIGSAVTLTPSAHGPITRYPIDVDPAGGAAGSGSRAELADRPERAALPLASRRSTNEPGVVDRAPADPHPLSAVPLARAQSRSDPAEWQNASADPLSSAPPADPPPSEPLDRSRAGRTAARRHDTRVPPDERPGPAVPHDPSDGGAVTELAPTVGGQQDALPSARSLAALRTIRGTVAAPEGPRGGEGSERAPSVRVTIGRIEVRSVPAPVPEPVRVSAGPPESRITLAEYLSGKRRSTP
jgi:hypothetical protein